MKYLICILILFFSFLGCQHKKQTFQEEEIKSNKREINLYGKQINSLNEIIGEKIKERDINILFLFNFHDCSSCIRGGFEIIKIIDQSFDKETCLVVGSNINSGHYQERYNYYNYIYNDDNDVIRRELKFAPTPMILLLDSTNMIIGDFFPTSENDLNLNLAEEILEYLFPID